MSVFSFLIGVICDARVEKHDVDGAGGVQKDVDGPGGVQKKVDGAGGVKKNADGVAVITEDVDDTWGLIKSEDLLCKSFSSKGTDRLAGT